jgi:cephalosporin-C deacetylase-like acetyl esterase/lysophospholipase L1-like esterase
MKWLVLLCLVVCAPIVPAADEVPLKGLVATLPETPPVASYGRRDGLVQEVWYESVPLRGKPTRVFGWLGRPVAGGGKAPAMVLVHGGGGRAFADWAKHWAERGYVALAMDTAGQGPDGKAHEAGGPGQGDDVKFRVFSDAEAADMWTWHAIAAVLRGHALVRSLPEVDPERTGITGISWGGYLTCLCAGLDPKFKVAVPVYGCGFLGHNSFWRDRSLVALDGESRERWLRWFDPATTAGGIRCPVLFLNGTHDFAYPPDSYRRTYSLVPEEVRTLSLRVDLDHGHIWTFGEVDAFADSVLRPGPGSPPLVRMGPLELMDGKASAVIAGGGPVAGAELHVTTMTGDWVKRVWRTMPAEVSGNAVSAVLPAERPLTYFFTVKDGRGLVTSTSWRSEGAEDNPAVMPTGKLEDDFYDWEARHEAVMKAKAARAPEIVMIGDSITHLWGGEPEEPRGNRGAESWRALFGERAVLNLGFGWDRTQNVLGRFKRGELDGLQPKLAVIHIGTNNLAGTKSVRAATADEIADGVQSVVLQTKAKCPGVRVVLMAVFPRGREAGDPMRARVAAINERLAGVAKVCGADWLDLSGRFVGADGRISEEVMPDGLHPSEKGYGIWAEGLKPFLP